ncbi:hypothetical protein CL628_02385 [bacterium]|nr:hypothetical protein [bacterium]
MKESKHYKMIQVAMGIATFILVTVGLWATSLLLNYLVPGLVFIAPTLIFLFIILHVFLIVGIYRRYKKSNLYFSRSILWSSIVLAYLPLVFLFLLLYAMRIFLI